MANAAVVPFPGRGIIWNRLKGSGTEPKNIAWGDSATTASANANVALFKPQTEARTAGTSSIITTTQLGDTYVVSGVITNLVATKTITEVGLFDTTTASSFSTLAASITAAATTMTLAANIGPTSGGNYYAQADNETILVTAVNAVSMTIARGQLGTTSAIHASGVTVALGGDGGAGGWTTSQTIAAAVTTSYGGNCFIKADFAGIALNVNDSINFTISDTLT